MPIRVVFKLFLVVFIYLLSSVFASSVLSATILNEDFNTINLDAAVWQVLNETNSPLLTGSYLNISNIDFNKSSFIQNQTPFKVGNGIKYDIHFKFNSMGFGNGIALNDSPVATRLLNVHPGISDWTIFVWPTSSDSFKVFSVACPEFGSCLPTDNPLFTVTGQNAFQWHDLQVEYVDGKYGVNLDNLGIKYTLPTTRKPSTLWIGNPMITGGTAFANLYVDYVYVVDNSPSFPYLSQLDPLWAGEQYDSASLWAPGRDGIGRWGCAITSVAMLLEHYGVKDPSGEPATPDKLNTWLQGQPDGYIGPGLLNWVAVTRYVKESYDAGKATTKLEFSRSSEEPTTLPAILGEPGHFVVAHASSSAEWKINDPNDVARVTKPKTDALISSNIYTPSMTNLAYFLFTTQSGVNLTLTDESASEIPLNWITEYLGDDGGGTSGETVRSAWVPKPASGTYRLLIEGAGETQVYLYDENGKVKQDELTTPAGTTEFEIEFVHTNIDESAVSELDTTPPHYDSTTNFAGWYTTPPTATFEYSDEHLVADYTNPSCQILDEGVGRTCNITPNVCDTSGNCNTTPQTSNPADTDWNAPSSSFTLPPITNHWDGNIVGTASDNVSGVAGLELMIHNPNGSEMTVLASGTENWNYTIVDPADGEYTILSRATDVAGNVANWGSEQKIVVDTVAPTKVGKLWAWGWWQRIWLDWRGIEGADKYRVYWGRKRDQLTNIAEVNETSWVSGALKQGQYYARIVVIDRAGNESEPSKIVKVEVHKKWDWRKLRWEK